MKQSDVCGSARGWGIKRPLVVSGGCDREVKVWDVETGWVLVLDTAKKAGFLALD